tara:strand:- start:91 stop:399 length:309 start_codon:yes stop_codon:yes gene_type:complete
MKNLKKGLLISGFLLLGTGTIQIPNLNLIPAAQASSTTEIYSVVKSGTTWSVGIKGSTLKLKKAGSTVISNSITDVVSFINSVKSKTGDSYSTIYNRIKSYI